MTKFLQQLFLRSFIFQFFYSKINILSEQRQPWRQRLNELYKNIKEPLEIPAQWPWGYSITAFNPDPAAESKIAASGPQIGLQGLEKCRSLGFWALCQLSKNNFFDPSTPSVGKVDDKQTQIYRPLEGLLVCE